MPVNADTAALDSGFTAARRPGMTVKAYFFASFAGSLTIG